MTHFLVSADYYLEIQPNINRMPTLLTIGPYRFFCYAGDRDEPPHIHVERDQDEAKFWLTPVRLENNSGFSRKEINRIQKLVEEHQDRLLEGWNDFFND